MLSHNENISRYVMQKMHNVSYAFILSLIKNFKDIS